MDSGFVNVDQAGDPTLYVRRLDAAGAMPFWQIIKQRTYRLLQLQAGQAAIDIGCGTGEDMRALAQVVGPTGRAVGLDRSALLLAEARRRSGQADVFLLHADAVSLPFRDMTFHGCRIERVLMHLDAPEQAVAEMIRVTRSGGRLVAAEPDWGTLRMDAGEPTLTRRVIEQRRRHFRSGTIGRQLPVLFRSLGLVEITTSLLTLRTGILDADGTFGSVERYASDARAAGVISSDEQQHWLRSVAETARTCVHEVTIFLASGTKP